jgi:hypothetical protein
MAAPSPLGALSRKRCLLASALSSVHSFLPRFQSPFWGWIFLPQTTCWLILFHSRFWIRKLCFHSLRPCRRRRATLVSPRHFVMLHSLSAHSSPHFRRSSAMVQGNQGQSTASGTSSKQRAAQFLPRRAVWILKSIGSPKLNSARLKKPELSAVRIRLGHRHSTWFRNRTGLGALAAIIAASILPRYMTSTLSRPFGPLLQVEWLPFFLLH